MPTPVLNYSALPPPSRPNAPAALAFALLTLLSIPLVLCEADWEPHYGIVHEWQMLLFVGGGSILLLAWALLSVWLITAVRRGRLARPWLAALLLVALVLLYLWQVPFGYAQDVANYSRQPPTVPTVTPATPSTSSVTSPPVTANPTPTRFP